MNNKSHVVKQVGSETSGFAYWTWCLEDKEAFWGETGKIWKRLTVASCSTGGIKGTAELLITWLALCISLASHNAQLCGVQSKINLLSQTQRKKGPFFRRWHSRWGRLNTWDSCRNTWRTMLEKPCCPLLAVAKTGRRKETSRKPLYEKGTNCPQWKVCFFYSNHCKLKAD